MSVLSAPAGLLDVFAFTFGRLLEALFVGDLRLADVAFNFKFAAHPVNDDVQVQFAHASDDRLHCFLVSAHAESGILFGELREGNAHFFLVNFGLRFNRQMDDRLGKGEFFKQDRMILVAKGVAGEGVLQTDGRGNVAGVNLINVFAGVGVHPDNTANAFTLSGRGIQDIRTGL